MESPRETPSFTSTAVVLYVAMILAALLGARWLNLNPWRADLSTVTWQTHAQAALYGLLAALPLMGLLVAFNKWPPRFFQRLKDSVDNQVLPLVAELSIAEFAILSLCAGVGEELLFRGLVQTWLEGWLPASMPGGATAVSVLIAGVIFGICHWINDQYAIMAAIVGIYLGVLFVTTEHLLAPIVAHASYDFFALWYLVSLRGKSIRKSQSSEPSPPDLH